MENNEKITVAAKMSERLIAIASMLGDGEGQGAFLADRISNDKSADKLTVADVGCDHGYVSIFLIQSGIAQKAIAMDVRKGPLAGAEENIREYGLESVIETRLSDGLKGLSKGDAEAIVIAGMGGKLMIRILKEGNPVSLGIKRAVLQPQSDMDEFRDYLRKNGFHILDEQVIYDEGKYYFPMKVSFEENISFGGNSEETPDYLSKAMDVLMKENGCDEAMALRICNRFGECNILRKPELLRAYCEHGKDVTEGILRDLEGMGHEARTEILKRELAEIGCVLKLYA